jgi:hypothetical protein
MRAVVDCLPYETKVAMLAGIERYEIVTGAYTTKDGGVCPMLAAHRCGGRTDFRSFARAWDRFTDARKRGRRASERELRTLQAQLEQSMWKEEEARDVLLERRPWTAPRRETRRAPHARRRRSFAAWLLPFRNLDDYRRALDAALEEAGEDTSERLRIAERLELDERDAPFEVSRTSEPEPLARDC